MKHIVQLDGLRAIAISLVILEHWFHFPTGSWGVTLFFVLSGYLISNILLSQAEKSYTHRERLNYLKVFAIRRALRIFPIYYLTVLVCVVINIPFGREYIWNHLTYTTNLAISHRGDWMQNISIFWSLSVEEQFYLIWPWVLLFLPQKYLFRNMIIWISIGFLSRFIGFFYDFGNPAPYFRTFTFTCFDAFGLGGLLAYVFRNWEMERIEKIFKPTNPIFIIASLAFLTEVLLTQYAKIDFIYRNVFNRFTLSVACFFIIGMAIIGYKGRIGSFLSNKAVVWLGQVSYGVYLFHNIIPYGLKVVFGFLNISFPTNFWIQVILYALVTFPIVHLSWVLIEKPINNLKSRFAY